MARSGGCTASIFWRLEEHNVVKWLLRGWSLNSLIDRDDDKIPGSLIIEGSPGIGKSTLLCLMAFHLVFKYKKRVFVYRSLGTAITALFYLGYEENETIDGEGKKVMTFHLENCGDTVARMIYDSLTQQYGPIWLLLDGFEKSRPPKDMRDFRLLSTSQQVDIKDRETEFMRACLLSAWTMNDLFKLGREAYDLMTEEMGERYYYTGGNARQFVRFREDKWCEQIHDRIAIAGKPPVRRSASDNDLIHELWRRFVIDATPDSSLVSPAYWVRVVDFEYALLALSTRLPAEQLLNSYNWSRSTGNGSLAGVAFELYMHALACDNSLKLFVTKYDPPATRKTGEKRRLKVSKLRIKPGKAFRGGTEEDYKEALAK